MGGLERLDILKAEDDPRRVPVIVLFAPRPEAGKWRGRDLPSFATAVSPEEVMDVVRTRDDAGAAEATPRPGLCP